jgi:hypothetical protein
MCNVKWLQNEYYFSNLYTLQIVGHKLKAMTKICSCGALRVRTLSEGLKFKQSVRVDLRFRLKQLTYYQENIGPPLGYMQLGMAPPKALSRDQEGKPFLMVTRKFKYTHRLLLRIETLILESCTDPNSIKPLRQPGARAFYQVSVSWTSCGR